MNISYHKIEADEANRSQYWQVAFGLQETDGLQPSSYMRELARQHIAQEIDFPQIYSEVEKYYQNQPDKLPPRSKEADLVSARIVEYLEEASLGFKPTPYSLKNIHAFLFKGVMPVGMKAGEYRTYNISKQEPVLKGQSVIYAPWLQLAETLQWDFEQELNKDYSKMTAIEKLMAVEGFISVLWQIHPFPEGNTRTTAVFTVLYLRSKGFWVDNRPFADNAQYFRDALVLANTSDTSLKTRKPLDEFFFQLVSSEKQAKILPSLREQD